MTIRWYYLREFLLRAWLPVGLLVGWHLLGASQWVSPLLLPSLSDTLSAGVGLIASGAIFSDLQSSAYRFVVGYGIAVIVGVPLGMLIGIHPVLHKSFEFVLEFGRATPVTAFFPLFLLLFGIHDPSKIAMVTVASVFIIILNSAYGVYYASRTRQRVGDLFRLSRLQRFVRITFWDALPQIVVGLRTALSLALIVVVVSEMLIGTEHGLGQRIFDAYTVSNSPELYALLLIIGVIGYFLNSGFVSVEKRVIHWKGY